MRFDIGGVLAAFLGIVGLVAGLLGGKDAMLIAGAVLLGSGFIASSIASLDHSCECPGCGDSGIKECWS